MALNDQTGIYPIENIERKIYLIRNQKIMLDQDLAVLYGVETKNLKRAVKRNLDRFPADFMFVLTKEEMQNLRCQNGTSRWGGPRYLLYAFTEQGVAMLSSVLKSRRAIQINIQIMRAFTRLREVLATHQELKRKVEEHDQKISAIFDLINKLLEPPAEKKQPKQFGFVPHKENIKGFQKFH